MLNIHTELLFYSVQNLVAVQQDYQFLNNDSTIN